MMFEKEQQFASIHGAENRPFQFTAYALYCRSRTNKPNDISQQITPPLIYENENPKISIQTLIQQVCLTTRPYSLTDTLT